MGIKNTLLNIMIILLMAGCGQGMPLKKVGSVSTQSTPPRITVWIHGTNGPSLIRKLHASPLGLRAVSELPRSYRLKSTVMALCKRDPEHFDCEHFYTFGWSGKLSPSTRLKASQELYSALFDLVGEYRDSYGVDPVVQLITHSHGGNVALNLASSADTKRGLVIDELILLACPVQEATKKLIKSPLFKKIYSVYSEADVLQVLDPQGLYKKQPKSSLKPQEIFSNRYFDPQENLKQARIKIRGRAPFHPEFIMSHFIQKMPQVLKAMDNKESHGKPMLVRL